MDTPVTALSKFFSSAGITAISNREIKSKKKNLKFEHRQIPQDFDENANQEPPTLLTNRKWLSSESSFLPSEIFKDDTNSFSSGYHSGSSHSAPSSCQINTCQQTIPPNLNAVTYQFEEHFLSPYELRRSQSCSFNWLVQRKRKLQIWPVISGIRRSSTLATPIIKKTSFKASTNSRGILCLPKLSTVGEDYKNQKDEQSSPISLSPVAKKQRLSASTTAPVASENLDDTIPLDCSGEEDCAVKSPINKVTQLPYNLLQNHSTPLPTAYSTCSTKLSDKTNFHLSRSLSAPTFSEAEKFLSAMDNDIASDGRNTRALPIIESTDSGLNLVSPKTVAGLLKGEYEKRGIKFIIVDCRFPYEYEGGHVKTSINLWTPNDLVQEVFNRVPAQLPGAGPPKLLGEGLARCLAVPKPDIDFSLFCDRSSSEESNSMMDQDNDLLREVFDNQASANDVSDPPCSRSYQTSAQSSENRDRNLQLSCEKFSDFIETQFVMIFHCEFSSQRAPYLANFLRSIDRASNRHRYPFLFFPEVYVMKGGYSEFFYQFPKLCDPCEYIKMFDSYYRGQLQFCKRLTKQVSIACQNCLKETDENVADSNKFDCSFGLPSSVKHIVDDVRHNKENICINKIQRNLCLHKDSTKAFSFCPTTKKWNDTGQEHLNSNFEGKLLQVAEDVVRVGRFITTKTQLKSETVKHLEPCVLPVIPSRKTRSPPNNLNGNTPCTPISNILSRPPLMNLSLHNSPYLETPVAAVTSNRL